MSSTLSTARLDLEAMVAATASTILGTDRPSDWIDGFPTGGERRLAESILRSGVPDIFAAPFVPYLMRVRETGLLVGSAGFHGPPRSGVVELGYGIAESARHHGYATEVCGALVKVAFDTGLVTRIVANIDELNVASKNVLLRSGFHAIKDLPTCFEIVGS